MAVPADIKFLQSHEWARKQGGVITVGVSDHAIEQLNKEIVYVELPDIGRKLKQGESFGVIESVKAASDLYAPVGGAVTEINELLRDNPSLAAEEPYAGGWMIKISPDNEADFEELLSSAEYESQIAGEAH